MIEVLINGEPVNLKAGSLNIQKNTTDFDTLTFSIFTLKDKKWFKEGYEVELFFLGVKKFGGFIHKVRENESLENYLLHNIQVKGYEYLLNKIPIAKAYHNEYAGSVVTFLWDEFFYDEGIRGGHLELGEFLHDIKFGYISGLTAMQRLAEKSNFIFRINENKELIFRSKEGYPAPFSLTKSIANRGSIRVSKGNSEYRNTQYIVGSKALTDTMTEEFKGDGKNKNFTLSFPVGARPKAYLSVNGGPFEERLVGFKELSTNYGYLFFFKMEDNVIVYNSDAEALTENDIIRIEYQGLYDVVVVNKIDYEIENRKKLDKGTGTVGKVIQQKIIGMDNIIQANTEILNKYGTQDGYEIEYETEEEGLEPGMLQEISLPDHNLVDTKGLITSVKIRDIENRLRYSVKVVNGPEHEDWVSFFSKNKNEDMDLIEGSEFIQPVYSYEKIWAETEFPNLFSKPVHPSNSTYPSLSLYPSFPTDKRIKYLAYYVNDVEEGRVPIISQSEVDNAIYSRAILGLDIEGQITKLAWIGGSTATREVGTGIYLDIQSTNLIKTELETMQIEKADKKGW
ncbi:hypothetical protein [Bacillus coahuilensis]|uniref:hypothetical protein n=1 Tax=Bacillus coahuilensis TaxID=408580 RepID=UPI0001850920|nr:hypothetical protein [Bacillus coahuilensis]